MVYGCCIYGVWSAVKVKVKVQLNYSSRSTVKPLYLFDVLGQGQHKILVNTSVRSMQIMYIWLNMLEKIQRRAARWITGCYDRYSSVTTILTLLKWPTLALRRKIARLNLFYSILVLPSYYQYNQRSERNS